MPLLLSRLSAILAIAACMTVAVAAQAERAITSISPQAVEQGETIMLTISGENLPQGSVVVEFYPQHIALLSVLSATDKRIEAQIKVPSLAPAGQYNIVIYNQLGEEVFAEALLSVTTKILTPVFRDYDPKSIAQASSGFALMLSGDVVTREAVDHLSMQWRMGDVELPSLQTTFAYGGHGTIVCAVSGDLPGGVLTGRVLLDEKPIYMVEVTLQSDEPVIVGNEPVQLAASAVPYLVRILGSGFTADTLNALAIELSSAETTARPRVVELIDAATLSAEFSGPLPTGSYIIRVLSGATLLYSGPLELTAAAVPDQPETAQPEASDEQGADGSAADVAAPPEELVGPAAGQNPDTRRPPADEPPAQITAVEPQVIDAGLEPCRLMFAAAGLAPDLLERLQITLSFGDADCELLFIGAGPTGFTCIFAAPQAGFAAGSSGVLTITDPEQQLAQFTQEMTVAGVAQATADQPEAEASTTPSEADAVTDTIDADASPAPAELQQEEQAEPAAVTPDNTALQAEHFPWTAIQSGIQDEITGPALIVHFVPPASGWDPNQVSASFSLLPDAVTDDTEPPLTLNGELRIGRDAGGLPIGTCPGRFVSGELLVRVIDGENPAQITALDLLVSGTVEVPVQPASASAPAGRPYTVQVSSAVVVIRPEGFDLACHVEARGLETAAWQVVNVTTDALILERNLQSFAISAELTEDETGTALVLHFQRDAVKLPDLAYNLLADELCGKPAVKLSLNWTSVDATAEADVKFERQS